MLEAIQHAEEIVSAQPFNEYQANRTAKRAVERLMQIITEASIHLTDEDKMLCEYTEWPAMRSLGNRIRHAYFSLDDQQVWLIVKDDLPILKNAIERTIREHFPNESSA